MNQAIELNFIKESMNTATILQNYNDPNSKWDKVIRCNCEYLPHGQNVDQIDNETALVASILSCKLYTQALKAQSTDQQVTNTIFDPINIYELMVASYQNNNIIIVDTFMNDTRINKLIYYIGINNVEKVKNILNTVDPRNNKFEAVYVAKGRNNPLITQAIKDNINIRIFLEYNVMETFLDSVDTSDNIYKLVSQHLY